MTETFSLVVVAAGQGSRMGGATAKQFLPLAGRPIWEWSALSGGQLFSDNRIGECVFVVPAGTEDMVRESLRPFSFPRTVVAGGKERSQSVFNGVESAKGDFVLIHDGARPFASPPLFKRVMDASSPDHGVVPLVPVSEALKRVDHGRVTPYQREGLFLTQTPQCFPRGALEEALAACGRGAKDEGEAWCSHGGKLVSVEGERRNMKITWPEDLSLAECFMSKTFRTGLGYDVHPLVPGRMLVLGGVTIPEFPLGVLGHSDGDPVVHALCDALLGAAGLGDIGMLYPAGDEAYKGIKSLSLLEDTARRVYALGWDLEWADGILVAQEPRLASHLPSMREAMNGSLPAAWRGRLSLKVKSGEGEGNVGQCCSMVSHAVVTLSAPAWVAREAGEKEGPGR